MNRLVPSVSRSNTWNRLKTLSLVLGLLGLTSCQAVPAQEKQLKTLSVSGQGVVAIPTTIAKVSLGVDVPGKTAAEVQKLAAQRSQALVELLKSRKVEKLETTGITLNPTYSYKDNEQRLIGYSGTNTVSFRIETDKAGTILDEAIKAGATRIDGISFVASESAIAAAEQQALREAAEAAKKQGNAVLAALNLSEQEVTAIQINSANPLQPVPSPMQVAREQKVSNSVTAVVGAEQQVQASVTLQIRYKAN